MALIKAKGEHNIAAMSAQYAEEHERRAAKRRAREEAARLRDALLKAERARRRAELMAKRDKAALSAAEQERLEARRDRERRARDDYERTQRRQRDEDAWEAAATQARDEADAEHVAKREAERLRNEARRERERTEAAARAERERRVAEARKKEDAEAEVRRIEEEIDAKLAEERTRQEAEAVDRIKKARDQIIAGTKARLARQEAETATRGDYLHDAGAGASREADLRDALATDLADARGASDRTNESPTQQIADALAGILDRDLWPQSSGDGSAPGLGLRPWPHGIGDGSVLRGLSRRFDELMDGAPRSVRTRIQRAKEIFSAPRRYVREQVKKWEDSLPKNGLMSILDKAVGGDDRSVGEIFFEKVKPVVNLRKRVTDYVTGFVEDWSLDRFADEYVRRRREEDPDIHERTTRDIFKTFMSAFNPSKMVDRFEEIEGGGQEELTSAIHEETNGLMPE